MNGWGTFQTAEQKAADKIREDWINSLPNELSGGELVDKIMNCVTDPWGNRLIDLPLEPVESLQAWLNKQDFGYDEE